MLQTGSVAIIFFSLSTLSNGLLQGMNRMKEPIKIFAEEPGLQVLNGRYGPYIAFDGKNYRIPKGQEPEGLTLEACRAIIAKSKK